MEIKVDMKKVKSLVLFQQLASGTCGGVDFTLNCTEPPAMIFVDFCDARYELELKDFVQAVLDDRKEKKKAIIL